MSRVRTMIAGAAAAASLVTLSGCGILTNGVYNTPLPGGADVGSHPLKLSADFSNVLDLVPQSSVKVDDVSVGRVTRIVLGPDERTAHVTFLVNNDVTLPKGTTARIRTTSLLGEKYIALQRPPASKAGPPLTSGTNLGKAKTSEAAEVEQVLGALSMVLNGGDIGQFQQISRELQKISTGRSGKIRDALTQINGFMTTLNARRGAITDALDGLEGLSKTLNGQRDQIAAALDGLSPGLKALNKQRPQLVKMLQALDRLSKVTVRTLNASQSDIVADFKALEPILDQLAKSGSDLPNALQILLTYPFPDSVLDTIKGDYMNAFVLTNFRTVPAGCEHMGCPWPQVSPKVVYPRSHGSRRTPQLLPPTSSATTGSPSPTVVIPSSSGPSTGSSTGTSGGHTASTSPSTTSGASPTDGASGPDTPPSSGSASPSRSASPSGANSAGGVGGEH